MAVELNAELADLARRAHLALAESRTLLIEIIRLGDEIAAVVDREQALARRDEVVTGVMDSYVRNLRVPPTPPPGRHNAPEPWKL